jgi:hypothetical protein
MVFFEHAIRLKKESTTLITSSPSICHILFEKTCIETIQTRCFVVFQAENNTKVSLSLSRFELVNAAA